MSNFWKFVDQVSSKGSDLIIEGDISSVTWWGDEVTPEAFRKELNQQKGDITVHINSNGGDVFAGVTIYNALKDYKHKVIVKVDGLAASIASVIAMAGDEIIMAPGSMMMVHNPWSMSAGSAEELRKAADILDEINDSIIPIYAERTGLSEEEIKNLLDDETWMSAEKAVELGFADKVVKEEKNKAKAKDSVELEAFLRSSNYSYSMSATRSAMNDFISKKFNNERDSAVEEDGKAVVAEEVEITHVNEDGTVEAVVDGEEATLTPADDETKEAVAEIKAEEEAEEAKDEAEVEEKAEDQNAEEGEAEEKEEAKEDEGEAIADKIEAEIKALRDENAALKAKVEELSAANDKANATINAKNALQARYAALLNMAETAEGGDVASEKEADKPVDNYAKSIEEAFKNIN